MCLIVLAWRVHPERPLIVAANRDEFHARPAARAAFWRDQPSILAGRDLQAGGTWMGVSRSGRFAAVTNYKGGTDPSAKVSRGSLVTGFLLNGSSPGEFTRKITPTSYSGFNLLVADHNELWWCSNRDGGTRRLEPGIYGLGNFFLDTPEVNTPKADFQHSISLAPAFESLFEVLTKSNIVAPEYGTRCATVLLRGRDGRVSFAERAFDAAGEAGETVRYEF
jgi:uncharacterized protein with NRDE domain